MIDLSQALCDADGSPSLNIKDRSPILLRQMLVAAMLETPVGVPLSEADKDRRYHLFKVIRDSGSSISLSDEDLSFVKQAVRAVFHPLARGEVLEMLEGKFVPPTSLPAVKAGLSLN